MRHQVFINLHIALVVYRYEVFEQVIAIVLVMVGAVQIHHLWQFVYGVFCMLHEIAQCRIPGCIQHPFGLLVQWVLWIA